MFKEIIEQKYKLLNGSQKTQIPSFIKKKKKEKALKWAWNSVGTTEWKAIFRRQHCLAYFLDLFPLLMLLGGPHSKTSNAVVF